MDDYLECTTCGYDTFNIISEDKAKCINCHKIIDISNMKVRHEINKKAIAELEKQAQGGI